MALEAQRDKHEAAYAPGQQERASIQWNDLWNWISSPDSDLRKV